MSGDDRPPTNSATDELMDALCNLRDRIVRWGREGERDTDLLRRYDYFIKNSNVGRGCTYAIKSKREFFSTDFQDIMEIIEQVVELQKKAADE